MNATLYTANGGTPQSITNGVSGQSFAPDFVWVKTRSVSNYHGLADSVRGVNKALFSNVTDAESTASSNYVTSFDTNGFSINQGGVFNGSSGTTMVAWQWKAGGTAVSNTVGSITSSVSANTTSGFSVVTYTGTGAAGTVGHGLGVAPSLVIYKRRSAADDWYVYHTSTGAGNYLVLNPTAASTANSSIFNNTAPTSTVFSVGSSTSGSGQTNVAYCWAPIAGYSAFGSYTGNGSADGPFVYLGFRPRFVMIKRTNSTADWMMIDTARSPFNVEKALLQANLSNAEDASTELIDGLSNGFKLRNGAYSSLNASGSTYIYMAFCENPFGLEQSIEFLYF
jgi:hypothetical protein